MKDIFKIVLFPVVLVIGLNSCKTKNEANTNAIDENKVSLKSAYTNDFLIGAAINDNHINLTDTISTKLIEKEFNTITPENTMKWMFIHPEKNSYNFKAADKYVALGERNEMHIVGHTLVWHSQLPKWVNTIKDSSEMAQTLKKHIDTLVGRYKGKIHTWDVVNEALNEDGTLRTSIFLQTMGEGYLELAFKQAAKADPAAQLVYNDYNLWKPEKRAGVVRLVKKLQANGAKIDGVGMQGHWSLLGPSIEDIENSILAYSALGVKVMFTELDVTALPNPWDLDGAAVNENYDEFEGDPKMNPYPNGLPESIKVKLAKRYEDIFNLFLKHQDKIDRVTFWGVGDGQSWLNNWPINGRTNYPLLFDRAYEPKDAYHSVMDLKK
ncbi:MAG: endo-1,4-beta-xylanase [Saonia sp.]